jgi:hypothetical protein
VHLSLGTTSTSSTSWSRDPWPFAGTLHPMITIDVGVLEKGKASCAAAHLCASGVDCMLRPGLVSLQI